MPKHLTIATLFAVAAMAAAPAHADDDCWVPMKDWQPRDAVAGVAEENGWTLRRIKIDDGCYEMVATDEAGRPLEVKINPATLEIIEIHHEDDDDERDEHDDD